jgi:hypothetical protein
MTKSWRRQNIGGDKTLAATKYLHQQNIAVDKILASTKYWIFFNESRKTKAFYLEKMLV